MASPRVARRRRARAPRLTGRARPILPRPDSKLESTKADALRFKIFYKDEIEEKLQIDESALILVALMSGGDYDEVRSLASCLPRTWP